MQSVSAFLCGVGDTAWLLSWLISDLGSLPQHCTGIPLHDVVPVLFIIVSRGQVYLLYGVMHFLPFSPEAWLFNTCVLFYFSDNIS